MVWFLPKATNALGVCSTSFLSRPLWLLLALSQYSLWFGKSEGERHGSKGGSGGNEA